MVDQGQWQKQNPMYKGRRNPGVPGDEDDPNAMPGKKKKMKRVAPDGATRKANIRQEIGQVFK